jgi:hypothetical protein
LTIDDPEQRGQHFGSLLMRDFLNDQKWMDKPVLVDPQPYMGDDPEYIEYLPNALRDKAYALGLLDAI